LYTSFLGNVEAIRGLNEYTVGIMIPLSVKIAISALADSWFAKAVRDTLHVVTMSIY
jgi:hypothetical protein